MEEENKIITEPQNKETPVEEVTDFGRTRVKEIEKLFDSEVSLRNYYDKSASYSAPKLITQEQIIEALSSAENNRENALEFSKKAYSINPIYAKIVNYFASLFYYRYTVIPRRYAKSGKLKEAQSKEIYDKIYREMVEFVDGLNLETRIPKILTDLYLSGGVYYTAFPNSDSSTINTVILPSEFCKKVGETQFGTGVISFDCSYFDSLGLSAVELKKAMKSSFPPALVDAYKRSQKANADKWQELDPRFSSCLLLNEKAIPNLIYLYGSILNFEEYQSNEIRKNSQLDTVLVHKIPVWQNQLILEIPEMNALHKKLAGLVNNKSTRLITTIGDVKFEKAQQNDTRENQILTKAFQTIFNNAGLNGAAFAGSNKESIVASAKIDKAIVTNQIEELMAFYNVVVNNSISTKDGYQAEISMLYLSRDTYSEDLAVMRENAKLGVGVLDFIVASGIKQKTIDSQLDVEEHLQLHSRIKPLLTSYTMTEDAVEKPAPEEDGKEVGPEAQDGQDKN